jgi:hypothetical protein
METIGITVYHCLFSKLRAVPIEAEQSAEHDEKGLSTRTDPRVADGYLSGFIDS